MNEFQKLAQHLTRVAQHSKRFFGGGELGEFLFQRCSTGYYVRATGRTPQETHSKGFEARLERSVYTTMTQGELRHTVGEYQRYNSTPFGIGACSNFRALQEGFVRKYEAMTRERTFYGFYHKGLNITDLIQHFAIGQDSDEPSQGNDENEHCIITHIPSTHFLWALTPAQQEAFHYGLDVVNMMAVTDETAKIRRDPASDLPLSFTKDDVADLNSILGWLFKHDALQTATEFCRYVFGSTATTEAIAQRLDGDMLLAKQIKSYLEDASNDENAESLNISRK